VEQKKTIDKILQESYKEIIDYLDLINRKFSRIRIIEERLSIIEDQLYVISNKVREMENILKGRINIDEVAYQKQVDTEIKKSKERTLGEFKTMKELKEREREEVYEEEIINKINTLSKTEKQIIKILVKNPDIKGGTALAKRIGKTREHVSRLLKKLANEGILIRDEKVWPYKYVVPEKVKQYIILENDIT